MHCNITCKCQGPFVLAVVQTSEREYNPKNWNSKQKKLPKCNNEKTGFLFFLSVWKKLGSHNYCCCYLDRRLVNTLVHHPPFTQLSSATLHISCLDSYQEKKQKLCKRVKMWMVSREVVPSYEPYCTRISETEMFRSHLLLSAQNHN